MRIETNEETLTEVAIERLIADIVAGARGPGEKLRIERLKQQYGIGASPLREALARLTAQGFVTNESRKGFRVAPMSQEDLEEITRVRQMIEIDAFRRAIEFGDSEWEIGLVSAFTRLKIVAKRHALDDFASPDLSRAHREFHRALIAACRSPRLLQLQGVLYEQAQRYRHLTFKNMNDVNHFIGRHEPLVEAAVTRDADAGTAALSAHLRLIIETVYPDHATPDPASTRRSKRRKRAGSKAKRVRRRAVS